MAGGIYAGVQRYTVPCMEVCSVQHSSPHRHPLLRTQSSRRRANPCHHLRLLLRHSIKHFLHRHHPARRLCHHNRRKPSRGHQHRHLHPLLQRSRPDLRSPVLGTGLPPQHHPRRQPQDRSTRGHPPPLLAHERYEVLRHLLPRPTRLHPAQRRQHQC